MTVQSAIAAPVGVVTALAQEYGVARKVLGGDCAQFRLVQAGMGRAAGYLAAEQLGRGNGRLAGLVSVGFCGGLDLALRSGSVIVPETVITREADERFDANVNWHATVMTQLSHLDPHAGRLFTAQDVISSTADKHDIATRLGACAVDMESAGIAHAARRLNVPFLAIRIIVDEATDSLPRATANAVKSDGNLDLKGLLKGLMNHPADLPGLIALGRKSSRAQKQLSAVCQALGAGFGLPA